MKKLIILFSLVITTTKDNLNAQESRNNIILETNYTVLSDTVHLNYYYQQNTHYFINGINIDSLTWEKQDGNLYIVLERKFKNNIPSDTIHINIKNDNVYRGGHENNLDLKSDDINQLIKGNILYSDYDVYYRENKTKLGDTWEFETGRYKNDYNNYSFVSYESVIRFNIFRIRDGYLDGYNMFISHQLLKEYYEINKNDFIGVIKSFLLSNRKQKSEINMEYNEPSGFH